MQIEISVNNIGNHHERRKGKRNVFIPTFPQKPLPWLVLTIFWKI